MKKKLLLLPTAILFSCQPSNSSQIQIEYFQSEEREINFLFKTAAEMGDRDQIKRLMDQNLRPNQKTVNMMFTDVLFMRSQNFIEFLNRHYLLSNQQTVALLDHAEYMKNLNFIEFLLDKGFKPNEDAVNKALICAANLCSQDVIEFLREKDFLKNERAVNYALQTIVETLKHNEKINVTSVLDSQYLDTIRALLSTGMITDASIVNEAFQSILDKLKKSELDEISIHEYSQVERILVDTGLVNETLNAPNKL